MALAGGGESIVHSELKFMVAFASPKRSSAVVNLAARDALAHNAELVLCRIIPDAEKVGIVAQLIATDRPQETANQHIEAVVNALRSKGVNASGFTRLGEVGPGLVKVAQEIQASMVYIGTVSFDQRPRFYMAKDPIVHYLVENCPVSLCLVRPNDVLGAPPLYVYQANTDADVESDSETI